MNEPRPHFFSPDPCLLHVGTLSGASYQRVLPKRKCLEYLELFKTQLPHENRVLELEEPTLVIRLNYIESISYEPWHTA